MRSLAVVVAVAVAARLGAQAKWSEQAVQLPGNKAPINGSLIVPSSQGTHPLVVIIAGSGPTDRNGNSPALGGGPNNLRQIAEALGERGIASVRYDKRGVAGSVGAATQESELRFDMYADDAAGWVKQYRGDARFGPIIVLGHSEGSLLGMLATQRAPADAFVSIAGVARRADQVLHDQLAAQLPPALLAQADSVSASLVAGKTVDAPAQLAMLFRPSVQPYIISWFKYSGADEIAKLKVPTLLVQGTNDIQVAATEVDSLAKRLPSAKVLLIPGMNHVCKITAPERAQQMQSYTDPTVPLAPGLVDAIAQFALTLKK